MAESCSRIFPPLLIYTYRKGKSTNLSNLINGIYHIGAYFSESFEMSENEMTEDDWYSKTGFDNPGIR
jgi:hypothetical protein